MTASIAPTRGAMSSQGMKRDIIPEGYQLGSLQTATPEQMQLYQQILGQTGPQSYLSRLAGGDEGLFKQMEEPAHRQFAQSLGGIASRFSGMGTGGRRSSGFQNTLGQAGSDFAQNLQAQRQQLQQQALKDLLGIQGELLNFSPYQKFLVPEQQKQPQSPEAWQQLLAGILPLAGAGVGGYFGGPMGMAAGGALGGTLGQGFLGQQSQPADWASMASLPTKWGTK
jgi:membrane protease subunit (stomatin/prohibitin family)